MEKDCFLKVRVSGDLLELARRTAEAEGVSVSELVRLGILRAAEERQRSVSVRA